MTGRNFTTAGEVACYLGAHLAGLAFGIFWFPLVAGLVRNNLGLNAWAWVLAIHGLLFMVAVLLLFLLARKLLAPRQLEQLGGRFTSSTEVGCYVLARAIGFTSYDVLGPSLLRPLYQSNRFNIGNFNPLVFGYAVVVMAAVMLLFFVFRKFLPRFNRIAFTVAGRISRFEYWVYGLAFYSIFVMAALVLVVSRSLAGVPQQQLFAIGSLGPWLVLYLWGIFAISIKRCHDRDWPGWFLLIALVPVISLWFAVEVGFLRGSIGPNRFGPDPVPDGGPPRTA